MPQDGYQYMLDLYREDGSSLGQVPVEVDWEPALNSVHFTAIRQGVRPPVIAIGPSRIEPIWSPEAGKPYLAGFRAVLLGNGDNTPFSSDISTTYLRGLAQRASSHFVETGQLEPGDLFRYLVSAFPHEHEETAQQTGIAGFCVKEIAAPLPIDDRPLGSLLSRSVLVGEPDEQDMPVFVSQHVLNEATALTREAGAKETGGVLIGYLHRDTASPEVMAEIVAQIPAAHSHSELTKLTFTAETWTAVRAALELRNDGTTMLGWWHSHTFMTEMCKDCTKRKNGTCNATAAFMSADDCALHRTVFPRAWSVALVVADSPCAGLTLAMFGWKYGMVTRRAFRVLQARRLHAPVESASMANGGSKDAQ